MTEEMNFSEAAESSVDRKGKKIKSNKNFMQAFEEVYKKHKKEGKETLIWANIKNNQGENSLKLIAIKSSNSISSGVLLCGFLVDGEKHSSRQLIMLYFDLLPSNACKNSYLLDAYAIVEMDDRANQLYEAAYHLKTAKKLFAEYYKEAMLNFPELWKL